jgi:hypothetical protein
VRVQAKKTAFALAGVIGGLALAGTAQAAEPGFTPDPESPAGVEYQIPLDTARGQGGGGPSGGDAQGGGGSPSGSPSGGSPSGSAPSGGSAGSRGTSGLFGSGISTPGKGDAKGPNGTRQRRGGAGSGSTAVPVSASASYSATGPVAGVVGGVLLIGGGIGLFLRLRGRRGTLS